MKEALGDARFVIPVVRSHVPSIALVAMLTGVGCSSSSLAAQNPTRVEYSELLGNNRQRLFSELSQRPAIVHFAKGDKIPVTFTLDSTLAKLDATTTASISAQREFFVMLRESGPPLTSLDGETFDPQLEAGAFSLGLDVSDDRPTMMHAVFSVSPEHPAPAKKH